MKYSVETGLFKNEKFALTQKEMLIRKGYASRIDEVKIERKKHLSVRVGLFGSLDEAQMTANQLISNERLKAKVIEINAT